MRRRIVEGTSLAVVMLAGHANADVLISNLPGDDGSQTAGINDGSRTKGMGFTMPSGPGYFLDELILRLEIDDVSVVPVIEIFSDAGGVPGTSLTTLDNPDTFSSGIANYSFTSSDQFTLDGDTSFWIVASSASLTYDWKASGPSQTPTGIATHLGATFGTFPPTSPSGILTSYELQGTLVPAPSALAMLSLGGLAAARRRR